MKKNNLINKIVESFIFTNKGGDADMLKDFEKVKDILKSTGNRDQLKVAVKTINQFLSKHKLKKGSPEYEYLENVLEIKKTQFGVGKLMRKIKRSGDDSEDLSERMNLNKIIREEIDDFQWMKEIKPEDSFMLSEAKIKVNKDEFIKLFEDKTILALKPLTHKASCKYGAGTKWCVTMRHDDQYWKKYTKKTSHFAGSNWYKKVDEVEKELKRNWLDKLLGRPPKVIKKEVKEFIREFPVGILYFVIVKKRIVDYEWDDNLKYNKPIYEPADPKDPMNKLAILYKPDRADFGDLSVWDKTDFYNYIGHKLDAAHNNMSIFNALDEKVILREVINTLGEQFTTPFAFIEEDFQKEMKAINKLLKNVLNTVYPLPGDKESKNPETWMYSDDGKLVYSDTSNLVKDKDGYVRMRHAKDYKRGDW